LEAFCDLPAEQEADETTKGLLRTLSETSALAHSEHLPRIPVEGDSSHIDRAKDALSRGKVRYKTIGGIGSRGHVWGTRPSWSVHYLERGLTRAVQGS